MNLKKLLLNYCIEIKYEITQSQVETVNHLQDNYTQNYKQTFYDIFINKKKNK